MLLHCESRPKTLLLMPSPSEMFHNKSDHCNFNPDDFLSSSNDSTKLADFKASSIHRALDSSTALYCQPITHHFFTKPTMTNIRMAITPPVCINWYVVTGSITR